MTFIGQMRRYLAHKLYTAPESHPEHHGLSTRGVCEYALDDRVHRDVIRELAYHMGHRRYYDEDGGMTGLGVLGDYARYDDAFPVSTDVTDYDSQTEFFTTMREEQRKHIVTCIEELVESKVVEYGVDTQPDTDSTEIEYVCGTDVDVDDENVVGVRPGPRFEHAVQSLMFIDRTTDSMNRWNTRFS